jgi:hypothetical protein
VAAVLVVVMVDSMNDFKSTATRSEPAGVGDVGGGDGGIVVGVSVRLVAVVGP